MAAAVTGSAAAGEALTLRALAAGLLVGSVLCFSNMYFGLQTGWVTMGSLQSAILGEQSTAPYFCSELQHDTAADSSNKSSNSTVCIHMHVRVAVETVVLWQCWVPVRHQL
jgi:hypothetical protein